MARHALGVLGVVAAGILLAVSAAMNYRFGFSLGKTALDGQIYGAASAAADCFKALVPFFLFAAIRNRMWSQAFAAALVWTVVTAYSMTSALGHAALNRLDTTGQRAVEAANYKDLRADSKRAQDQLTWIPAHRPAETVASELNVIKAQRYWVVTRECTEVTGKGARDFCQQFHKLNAELASAQQSQKLESRIAEIGAKLAKTAGGTVMAEADPQASVLCQDHGPRGGEGADGADDLRGAADRDRLGLRHVRGLRLLAHQRPRSRSRRRRVRSCAAQTARRGRAVARRLPRRRRGGACRRPSRWRTKRSRPPPSRRLARRLNANDNRLPRAVPDSDVQRFYRERVVAASESSSLTSTELYEEYCRWCEDNEKEPFAHPRVTREIGELGVKKERIGKRTRYFGIALRSEARRQEDKKLPTPLPRAA